MQSSIPIQTIHLFEPLDQHLIELLKSIGDDDWNKPTIAKLWTVKDIATHLLDGNFRAISIYRDNYMGEAPGKIESNQALVDFLNQLNADWVQATKRLSPKVIIDLLEITGKEYLTELKKLKPYDNAIYSVAWAGEGKSENWFHIAREYTEKFHHQMQIRDAVGEPGLMTKEFFNPFIDTFLQGLPYTYRNIIPSENTVLKIVISTEAGGNWFLQYNEGAWKLNKENCVKVNSTVIIPPDIAWKLFSRGIELEEAKKEITIYGDKNLAETSLTMVSVMA